MSLRSESIGLVPVFLLIAVVAWQLGILIYRLFLSPLSRLPGPWLTKISSVPEANALKAQKRARWVTELFEKHPGAVAIRTGPNSVSFNSPEAVKAIYGGCTWEALRMRRKDGAGLTRSTK